MSLPKEPRQKMINFMYIVLTAMLALNVSGEILQAFKVVDNSLVQSNGIINQSNKTIQSALDAAMKEGANRDQAAIWKPFADQSIAVSDKVAAYIENLKQELKKESGLTVKDGVEVFKEDDLDAPTRFFGTKGEGPKLKAELEKFQTDLINIFPEKEREKVKNKIKFNIEPQKGQDGQIRDWTVSYFHMTPTIAAITLLSKFQNDVKRAGNQAAEEALNHIGKVEVVYDQFEALVSQNSEYLLPGQPLKIRAGLGTFSSQSKPVVTINGAVRPLNAQGFAEYEENANGGGERSINVTVAFKDPNTGKELSKTTQVKYTVGTPSGASIFLSKMNVMYLGVDNPVTISAGSIKAENMRVSFNKGTLTKSGGDNYIAKVSSAGEGTITISGDGKTYSFPIRCKKLPPPTPIVGTLKSGKVSSAQFKAMGGLRAILDDSEFQAGFTIVSYTIGGIINGEPRESTITGPSFAGNAIIQSAKPGSAIGITNIIAKGPDGSNYKLGDLFYQLQ
ncbi:type IX secretion system motor protein PorM/GldM [Polluticaenibacter yanchengensis]|uniref:Gliding motility protein GldM n=1 Tax=Polluticaenibacter yanchengensis TaxID=3014562 RepID=A0ABT4UJI9_9BACT|nr:gliding motility protein GldM [Chitinophagaceae bacterium LY-5]